MGHPCVAMWGDYEGMTSVLDADSQSSRHGLPEALNSTSLGGTHPLQLRCLIYHVATEVNE